MVGDASSALSELDRFTTNPRRRQLEDRLSSAAGRWIAPVAVARARQRIQDWPGYAPYPAEALGDMARSVGIGSIHYQNEGLRFGLQSFKGWGGGYATAALYERSRAIHAPPPTVACATDGNHGRAVAWAAQGAGGRCVVYVANIVTEARAELIAGHGAEIVRSEGNHEVASAECLAAARENGWYVITETENATVPEIATDTLAGYGALWEETFESYGTSRPPTHLFVQAGVGGLAAVAAAISERTWGSDRPILTVVEAHTADCIRQGLERGERVTLDGEFDTGLAGLAAGATSTFAWDLLSAGADHALAIDDGPAEDTVRWLAEPGGGDPTIEAGTSGASGLAGALTACSNLELRERIGLNGESRVLVIGTEGPTDAAGFERLTGRPPKN